MKYKQKLTLYSYAKNNILLYVLLFVFLLHSCKDDEDFVDSLHPDENLIEQIEIELPLEQENRIPLENRYKVPKEKKVAFKAYALYTKGEKIDITNQVVWSSEDGTKNNESNQEIFQKHEFQFNEEKTNANVTATYLPTKYSAQKRLIASKIISITPPKVQEVFLKVFEEKEGTLQFKENITKNQQNAYILNQGSIFHISVLSKKDNDQTEDITEKITIKNGGGDPFYKTDDSNPFMDNSISSGFILKKYWEEETPYLSFEVDGNGGFFLKTGFEFQETNSNKPISLNLTFQIIYGELDSIIIKRIFQGKQQEQKQSMSNHDNKSNSYKIGQGETITLQAYGKYESKDAVLQGSSSWKLESESCTTKEGSYKACEEILIEEEPQNANKKITYKAKGGGFVKIVLTENKTNKKTNLWIEVGGAKIQSFELKTISIPLGLSLDLNSKIVANYTDASPDNFFEPIRKNSSGIIPNLFTWSDNRTDENNQKSRVQHMGNGIFKSIHKGSQSATIEIQPNSDNTAPFTNEKLTAIGNITVEQPKIKDFNIEFLYEPNDTSKNTIEQNGGRYILEQGKEYKFRAIGTYTDPTDTTTDDPTDDITYQLDWELSEKSSSANINTYSGILVAGEPQNSSEDIEILVTYNNCYHHKEDIPLCTKEGDIYRIQKPLLVTLKAAIQDAWIESSLHNEQQWDKKDKVIIPLGTKMDFRIQIKKYVGLEGIQTVTPTDVGNITWRISYPSKKIFDFLDENKNNNNVSLNGTDSITLAPNQHALIGNTNTITVDYLDATAELEVQVAPPKIQELYIRQKLGSTLEIVSNKEGGTNQIDIQRGWFQSFAAIAKYTDDSTNDVTNLVKWELENEASFSFSKTKCSSYIPKNTLEKSEFCASGDKDSTTKLTAKFSYLHNSVHDVTDDVTLNIIDPEIVALHVFDENCSDSKNKLSFDKYPSSDDTITKTLCLKCIYSDNPNHPSQCNKGSSNFSFKSVFYTSDGPLNEEVTFFNEGQEVKIEFNITSSNYVNIEGQHTLQIQYNKDKTNNFLFSPSINLDIEVNP